MRKFSVGTIIRSPPKKLIKTVKQKIGHAMEYCNWSNLKISCWQRSFAPLTFSICYNLVVWKLKNKNKKRWKNEKKIQINFLLLFEIFVLNKWQVVDSQIRTHRKQFILINRRNVHVTPPIPNITIQYFECSYNNPSNVSHISSPCPNHLLCAIDESCIGLHCKSIF